MLANRLKFNRAGGISVALLLVWLVVVSLPLTFLAASHALPLPTLGAVAVTTQSPVSGAGWRAVHILVADCPCSERVAQYLAGRGARRELAEEIWVVGGAASYEAQLKKCGFAVQERDAETIATELGIQGGPWLRLISPAGAVVYSGGYAPQRPRNATEFCDLDLWRAVVRGETVAAYPAFGCAASRWLRQTLDPLGLKNSAGK